MTFIDDFDDSKKKSFISLLMKMAKQDEQNHPSELEFIRDVGLRIGLTEDDLFNIRTKYDQFNFNLPEMENERMNILIHLLHLMQIDRSISESETLFCKKLGLKLAINPLLVEELINVYKKYIDKTTPAGLIPSMIKKYMN